jgi:hypothetical protein
MLYTSNVFNWLQKPEDFPWLRADRLGQESNRVRIIMGWSNPYRRVENLVNMLVTVNILPEHDQEKLQLIMQAAQSFIPMRQGGMYVMLAR